MTREMDFENKYWDIANRDVITVAELQDRLDKAFEAEELEPTKVEVVVIDEDGDEVETLDLEALDEDTEFEFGEFGHYDGFYIYAYRV